MKFPIVPCVFRLLFRQGSIPVRRPKYPQMLVLAGGVSVVSLGWWEYIQSFHSVATDACRHLVDGGELILDLFNPSLPRLVEERYLAESGEEPEFTMPDGRKVVRRHRTVSRDLFNQVMDSELIYYVTHPDGREERLVHRFHMRYLFRFEAEHLLARSGFEVENVYSDYDKSSYGAKYPGDLIIVARKA